MTSLSLHTDCGGSRLGLLYKGSPNAADCNSSPCFASTRVHHEESATGKQQPPLPPYPVMFSTTAPTNKSQFKHSLDEQSGAVCSALRNRLCQLEDKQVASAEAVEMTVGGDDSKSAVTTASDNEHLRAPRRATAVTSCTTMDPSVNTIRMGGRVPKLPAIGSTRMSVTAMDACSSDSPSTTGSNTETRLSLRCPVAPPRRSPLMEASHRGNHVVPRVASLSNLASASMESAPVTPAAALDSFEATEHRAPGKIDRCVTMNELSVPRGWAMENANNSPESRSRHHEEHPKGGNYRFGPTGVGSPSTSGTVTASKTRTKLVALQSKIVKFESQLQTESLQRRAAEDGKLAVLREAVSALEKTAQEETRHRVETHKVIQSNFDANLAALERQLQNSMEEKEKQISRAVADLAQRIDNGETELRRACESQAVTLLKMESDVQATLTEMQSLRDTIEKDCKSRKQREAVLFDKLSEITTQIDSRISMELAIRAKDVNNLRTLVEEAQQNHVALDEAFQRKLASDFHELKLALQAETQVREQADEDIVQALNHYTVALQSALRIANAT